MANGFPSENKYIRSTQQSNFMESAYAHNIANHHSKDIITGSSTVAANNILEGITELGKGHGHVPMKHGRFTYSFTDNKRVLSTSSLPRTDDAVCIPYWADIKHSKSRVNSSDNFVKNLIDHKKLDYNILNIGQKWIL